MKSRVFLTVCAVLLLFLFAGVQVNAQYRGACSKCHGSDKCVKNCSKGKCHCCTYTHIELDPFYNPDLDFSLTFGAPYNNSNYKSEKKQAW